MRFSSFEVFLFQGFPSSQGFPPREDFFLTRFPPSQGFLPCKVFPPSQVSSHKVSFLASSFLLASFSSFSFPPHCWDLGADGEDETPQKDTLPPWGPSKPSPCPFPSSHGASASPGPVVPGAGAQGLEAPLFLGAGVVAVRVIFIYFSFFLSVSISPAP